MKRIGLWLSVIFLCLAVPAGAAIKYELIILTPSPGYTDCSAYAINNRSEIVGHSGSDILYGPSSPVYWSPGSAPNYVPQNLGTFGDNCGVAFGINDGSYVVGRSGLFFKGFRAFIWNPAWLAIQPLGDTLPTVTQAWDLNIHGVVAGRSGFNASLFELGKPTVLLNQDPNTDGYAFAVNDSGLVAGWYENRAVVWDSGIRQELATGYNTSMTWKVNRDGEVIGQLNPYTENDQAFIWEKFKGLRTYDHLKNAVFRDLNNKTRPQVVGYYTHPVTSIKYAFIWEEGQALVDLNARLVNSDGWLLTEANGINDKGEIVGLATKAGSKRGFLLRPKLPGAGILMLLLLE